MFEKKDNEKAEKIDVFRAPKGSSKVVIGDAVVMKGEITNAHEVQIDGVADVVLKTENLIVGASGKLKGTIETENADIWGKVDGDLKVSNTLTIQELGAASGKIEYAKMQIKLGGDISGELIKKEKVISIEKNKHQKEETKPLQDALDK
jgi:cytoskeletal protein CcmA (bactofilin family)|tara:strand:+ start:81 stop:527 length:447 start_codon:yes stop_codon:yes gene_type:complete